MCLLGARALGFGLAIFCLVHPVQAQTASITISGQFVNGNPGQYYNTGDNLEAVALAFCNVPATAPAAIAFKLEITFYNEYGSFVASTHDNTIIGTGDSGAVDDDLTIQVPGMFPPDFYTVDLIVSYFDGNGWVPLDNEILWFYY